MTDAVIYEQDGSVVTLTLNRPDTRNAITDDICEALVAHCGRIDRDLSVRCVILTGAGKGFSSGGNVKDMRDRAGLFGGSTARIRAAYRDGIQRLPLALYRLEVPVVAAVNGAAVGAGFDIAMMCDMRIASTRASFAEVFVKLGIIPGGGATARLPRIVGRGWAMEMMLMGEPIDAERALSIGLVTRIVPKEELLPEARRMADHLATFAPFVPRTMKAMVHFGMEASLAGALMLEKYAQGALVQTEDKQEGIKAFLEKRKPEFKGR